MADEWCPAGVTNLAKDAMALKQYLAGVVIE